MALGDLMAFRLSQSSSAVSNHLEECKEDDNRNARENGNTNNGVNRSYGYANGPHLTSVVYLPQNTVLCELRHEAFEGNVPSGPLNTGLVSKWRPKDRVSCLFFALYL